MRRPTSASSLLNARPRLRRSFVTLTVATLVVFAVLLTGLTLKLRAQLRLEIQRREAEAISAVAGMEIRLAEMRATPLGGKVSNDDLFGAVLESSRLSGVLAVQLFDPSGVLREALPATVGEPSTPWWPHAPTDPLARYYRRGSLDQVFGLPTDPNNDVTRTSLLEIVVPLRGNGSTDLGVARYWIEGTEMRDEFHRLDLQLLAQAGIAFLGGALLLGVLLRWTYRRLADAQHQLIAQSADLARANEELDFAAKTGALGAISAHLIHGLKNPLAGLEGFVSEAAPIEDDAARGQARQTAVETARRLRALVNDVVAVLHDEAAGSADYPVPLREAVGAVQARANPLAIAAGVTLSVKIENEAQLKARTANLAGLVLANLLANAIEASPRNRAVRFEARRHHDQIEFVVADAGPGLPDAVLESLFRPVRSTKPGGGGMGLAISYRLARHVAGELALVRSDLNGTEFRFSVPAA